MIHIVERQGKGIRKIFGILQQNMEAEVVDPVTGIVLFGQGYCRREVWMQSMPQLLSNRRKIVIAVHLRLQKGRHDLQPLAACRVGLSLQIDGAGIVDKVTVGQRDVVDNKGAGHVIEGGSGHLSVDIQAHVRFFPVRHHQKRLQF